MITEKAFAEGYGGFWRALLPMTEHLVRAVNLGAERFVPPLDSDILSSARGLVGETAFRLFTHAHNANAETVDALDQEAIRASVNEAWNHVVRMRAFARTPPPPLRQDEVSEAQVLADRMFEFFKSADLPLSAAAPKLLGCGWLSTCYGDALANLSQPTLVEFKSGLNPFRGTDLRQLLIYSALAFVSKELDLSHICLCNPRRGLFSIVSVEDACRRSSGRSAVEILSDIVDFVSEPLSRTGA